MIDKWFNRIVVGDCVKLMKYLPDESVDLLLTDPPYDVDYGKKSLELERLGKARIKQVKRDKTYKEFSRLDYNQLAREWFRILKPDTHAYVFCGDKQIKLWDDALTKAGFKFRNYMVWVKNSQTFDMTFGLKYCYKTEICMFFNKGVKKLNRLGLNNVLKYDTLNELKHPTQKPVGMFKDLILNSSNPGDLVLDCFMGSGTTALASRACNRNYIGFEISDEYVKISYDRLKQQVLNKFGDFGDMT